MKTKKGQRAILKLEAALWREIAEKLERVGCPYGLCYELSFYEEERDPAFPRAHDRLTDHMLLLTPWPRRELPFCRTRRQRIWLAERGDADVRIMAATLLALECDDDRRAL